MLSVCRLEAARFIGSIYQNNFGLIPNLTQSTTTTTIQSFNFLLFSCISNSFFQPLLSISLLVKSDWIKLSYLNFQASSYFYFKNINWIHFLRYLQIPYNTTNSSVSEAVNYFSKMFLFKYLLEIKHSRSSFCRKHQIIQSTLKELNEW